MGILVKHGQDQFVSIRKNACDLLEEVSLLLERPTPDIPQITQNITQSISSLETLQFRAFYEKEHNRCDLPDCLPERFTLIKEIHEHFLSIFNMESTLEEKGIKKRFYRRASLMIAVLSTHVGRITFDRDQGALDRFAKHCDKEVLSMEVPWSSLGVDFGDSELGGMIDGLVSRWEKINLQIDGCECIQCTRRRPYVELTGEELEAMKRPLPDDWELHAGFIGKCTCSLSSKEEKEEES